MYTCLCIYIPDTLTILHIRRLEMKGYLSILCLVAGLSFALSEDVLFGPNTWAVLVAGSSGWYNYRHQADVCHAYQALIAKGIQKEKIITLMYDDIANNEENPKKGTIINRPKGPDVYHDVVIDYKGSAVNAKNFLNILEGNEAAMKNIGSGKVLKSSENDTVFVNFADHGGPGILCFPRTTLKANELIATLNKMSKNKLFAKLVLYIEACESGSIFDGFINHLENVFVSTAAGADESSYGWYCEDEKYGTCFGDHFSVTWMERLDKVTASETLFDDYNAIRTAVNDSHVQVYGDYKLGFLKTFSTDEVKNEEYQTEYSESNQVIKGVDSRDIPVYLARKALENAKEPGSIMVKKEKLEKMIQARGFADNLMSKILEVYTEGDIDSQKYLESTRLKLNLEMFSCYDDLLNAFETSCFSIPENTYILKHLYKFTNICLRDITSTKAVTAIQTACNAEMGKINTLGINIE
ncbi:legumain [Halyomorpha halys]|uniref:legumain n=1 Tax=Halyomorpha halys TaxID=286706 RepID=UPI0006D51D6E|nr:legumain-like [Halyomorpha halys]